MPHHQVREDHVALWRGAVEIRALYLCFAVGCLTD